MKVVGAGIFSKFMRLIQCMADKSMTIEKTYLDVTDSSSKINQNMINFCILQTEKPTSESIKCENYHTYTNQFKIENSKKFSYYKNICDSIFFTSNLSDLILEYTKKFSFDENFIGVHIRLCDMNTIHGKDYGVFRFEDFQNEIDKIFTEDSKIFVASDNDESLEKIKNIYSDKVFFVPNMIRAKNEIDDSYQLQIDNMENEDFWIQSFLDMYLLSKCKKLICRTSNLSNASICFSNSFKEIIRL